MDISVRKRGLTDSEAERSRLEFGSNEIDRKKKISFMKQYLASFGDPIIKILLIALFVNLIFLFKNFNWYESAGIAAAVFLATFVSTLSEYGSESAFEKLQEEAVKIKCRVKRSNIVKEVSIGEIVAGDIVLIQAGERIPADGIIIEGSVNVDQSALNGETKEAHKYPSGKENMNRKNNETAFLKNDLLFRGSVVCSGECVMLVKKVGRHTFYGKLAIEIQEETIESPLKSRLKHLAQVISRFGYIAAFIVVFANVFNNVFINNRFNSALITAYLSNTPLLINDILNAFILGITVIVMAVPEGLPMMITVVLSSNMKRMLKDNVLVRKLVGIETSGSLNILFTDKTGTLTKGNLEAVTFMDGEGNEYDSMRSLRKYPYLHEMASINCYYNNGAQISEANGKKSIVGGNSTDRALLKFVYKNNITHYEKGEAVPFDSRNKLSICEINGSKHLYLIKGAPEKLLAGCTNFYDKNGEKKLFRNTTAFNHRMFELTQDSIRLLALCVCEKKPDINKLSGLTLIGLIGIRDEIRKEAVSAIKQVAEAGIQVVMITGDNKETAVSVALKTGLINDKYNKQAILTSAELNVISDEDLKKRLPEIRVIARALPADKSRLVRIAQEMGFVAGMTGDGVNDAPALKKADVGFAMGDGTEIAKEAGDIVILDNNFNSIAKAILYGRTIFKSIRKFIIFQLTVNLCAVCISVIGPFIGVESPVTVIQMLWINIIMDTLAGLAFAGEIPLREYMKEPPKSRNEKIISRYMYNQIVYTGLYTTLICILFLKLPFIQEQFNGNEGHLMTGFFALFIFAGIFNSFNARTYRLNLFSYIYKNKGFIFIMGIVFVIQLFIIYYGGTIFRTTGLNIKELRFILMLSCTVIFVDFIRKLMIRGKSRKGYI